MDPGHVTGLCVRSIKVCPGLAHCRLAKQDSIQMGMALNETYHGMVLPSKMKMGVSGCKIQCAENCIKDISLYGTDSGWTIMIGGNGSAKPRLADILAEDLSYDEALAMVETVIDYYKTHSKRERMGRMIERMGLDIIKSDLKIVMVILFLADEFIPYDRLESVLKTLFSKLIKNINQCT